MRKVALGFEVADAGRVLLVSQGSAREMVSRMLGEGRTVFVRSPRATPATRSSCPSIPSRATALRPLAHHVLLGNGGKP